MCEIPTHSKSIIAKQADPGGAIELRDTKCAIILAVNQLLIDGNVANWIIGGFLSVEGVVLVGGGS